MIKVATLITENGLDLPCVVLPTQKSLFPVGKEVTVYCQNRLVRGYIEADEDFVAEIEIVAEFAMIPEYDEFLKENSNNHIVIGEIYYV